MRSWIIVSGALIALGAGIFLYKLLVLHYPLNVASTATTWRVELGISLSGDKTRVAVDALLPRTSGYQRVLTEEVRPGPFRFSIAEQDGGRHGRWSGKLNGSRSISYQVAFEALRYHVTLPEHEAPRDYPKSVQPWLEDAPGIPKSDVAIAELSTELDLKPGDNIAVAREIYRFVRTEIGVLRAAGEMDPLTVIREGRGNPLGRARLFCALARANHLPCRIVPGLVLESGTHDTLHYWNEVYLGEDWVPFDSVLGIAENMPADRLAFSSGATAVSGTGTSSLAYRFTVETELAAYSDLMRRRLAESNNWVDRASLLFLPLSEQETLRLLLLVPLGALAMSVLRSMIGIRTFGMFMPMLLALALTSTGLLWGTAFLTMIVSVALLSRIWIKRLYLLLVARVAFILTLVILLMVALFVIGDRYNFPTAGVGAFPFVIMTMIVERISVSLEEEGFRNTISRISSTILAVYITYAVIQAKFLGSFMLVFPELLIIILGLLIGIGRYTGYRLSELFRFRELAVE